MKELGILASITGTSRQLAYSVENTSGAPWIPASIILSSEVADVDWEIYIDKTINDLYRPGPPTLTPATTGGTIPRNTNVYVRVTTVDGSNVEGPPSPFTKAVTGSTTDTNKIGVSWTAVSGAAGYKVYAGTLPGMEAFVDVVTGTSLDITELPANAVDEIPTLHSYMVYGAATRLDSIPLTEIYIYNNLKIITIPSATTRIAISIPLK